MVVEDKGKILLYTRDDGSSGIEVKFEGETIRLNQVQMSALFDVNVPAISKHLDNIYREGELKKGTTVSKMEIVQKEGSRNVKRSVDFYNLDAIISVGYRVNSKSASNFRIRATSVLKKHLVQGYTFDQKRLSETGIDDLERAVLLVKKNIENNILTNHEIEGMLSLITKYAHSWILLQKYDEGSLSLDNLHIKKTKKLDYNECILAIDNMKHELLKQGKVSDMFGVKKNDGLKGVINQIYQTFDGLELYPSVEEKAAALLYFIIKNHPFADGNKKIGAFLFVVYLAKNNHLYTTGGVKIIDDATLVALTLLIATSDKGEKDMILKLVASFLSKKT